MTIDEAIRHCEEVAEQNEKEAPYKSMYANRSARECLQCAADHRQLAEWLTELKEAKRLLRRAIEDIHELLCDKKNLDGNGQSCNICSYIEWCPCCKECTIREDLRNWRYADEAKKLIKDRLKMSDCIERKHERDDTTKEDKENSESNTKAFEEIKEQLVDKKKDFHIGDKVWIRKDLTSPYAEIGFITEAGEIQSRVFFSYSNEEKVLDNILLIKA